MRSLQAQAQSTAQFKNTFSNEASLIAAGLTSPNGVSTGTELKYDDLTPVEQAAASLGVSPASYKPIKGLNDAYYTSLKKQNALDPTLQRRIEAFSYVAGKDASVANA